MSADKLENEGRFATAATGAPQLADSGGYGGIVLERLARHTCRVAGVNWTCLFVRDRIDPRLVIAAAGHGIGWDLIGCRFAADEGAVGNVLRSGEPIVLDDFRALAPPVGDEDDHPRAGAAVPIRVRGGVGGVLSAAMTGADRKFAGDDLDLLADLSELAAAALEHTTAGPQLELSVQAQVEALAAAMDMRDRRTASHSEDVVALARRLGQLLDLGAASLVELEFAARLHDVGKIQVPDAVLHKPGPLDAEESRTIRFHATWGSDTLARIAGLEAVATVVRFHHERWDGRGYPDGLAGARIPLASRIIAVCDAYGAMTTDRPYRAAMDERDALEEIRAGSGSQFDPAVVDAFVEAFAAS